MYGGRNHAEFINERVDNRFINIAGRVSLTFRASRAINLANFCLPAGMSEEVSRFCMVLKNGSNKAYAALAMYILPAAGFAEKIPPRLLSWLKQPWALYGPSLWVATKVKARTAISSKAARRMAIVRRQVAMVVTVVCRTPKEEVVSNIS
ncbi:hypothetical protein SARC_02283 [Sphaeroforma arctica JP610]|uniref:Uncharacterized protein n=1 Tax=Sphaeroforma arctica JP610 TaxID=667725 RepID=A0A0L0G918_9EUKA|nr:hypothetical protein SARC_02283 [Sphaeroforma arctica JP610]KNC85522.1 hypothetical protein SARC_02283 [Sphaeroforma arctica JP610]|eukprot:XP_014159424.1 hypothetical protein SARC_02283 [Sphaeroforma arctica JP610]